MKHAQADTTDNVQDHIPEAPHSADFSSPSDNIGNLRFAVFPTVHAQKLSVRVLRATIFRRLEPVTNLQSGAEFMKVWFECVHCHYTLWKRGVEHASPGIVNLMTNGFDKNKGILNDWDLAIVRVPDKEILPHSERREMSPFMAIDLLSEACYDGHMKRLYRHDLEAFIWILPWVFLQYENGKRKTRVLQGWENTDYRTVRDEKSGFLVALSEENVMEQFGNEWVIAQELFAWLLSEQGRRAKAARKGSQSQNPTNAMAKKLPSFIQQPAPNAEPKEKEPKEVYSKFWSVIAGVIANNPALEYVYDCIPDSI